jgi:hypothetical protein
LGHCTVAGADAVTGGDVLMTGGAWLGGAVTGVGVLITEGA